MKRGVVAALAACVSAFAFSSASVAADPPQFQVDPFWPKPLPNNWLLGQVASVSVGPDDHVWLLQRPRSLTDDEKGATLLTLPGRANGAALFSRRLIFD